MMGVEGGYKPNEEGMDPVDAGKPEHEVPADVEEKVPFSIKSEEIEANPEGSESAGSTIVVTVSGECDKSKSKKLGNELSNAIESGARALIVDLSNCPSVDARGFGQILMAASRLRTRKGGCAIVVSEGSLPKKQLDEVEMDDRVMPVFTSIDDALGTDIVMTANHVEGKGMNKEMDEYEQGGRERESHRKEHTSKITQYLEGQFGANVIIETETDDFLQNSAKRGEFVREIKKKVERVFGDGALSRVESLRMKDVGDGYGDDWKISVKLKDSEEEKFFVIDVREYLY